MTVFLPVHYCLSSSVTQYLYAQLSCLSPFEHLEIADSLATPQAPTTKPSTQRSSQSLRCQNIPIHKLVFSLAFPLTLQALHHTIPHQLCGCEVKDVHGLQSFVSTHSEEGDRLLFILCLQQQMLLTSAFSKQNSAISLEEWVLVFKVFTTDTRQLRV